MTNRSIKKIGLVCLGITSLSLVGCFHIPDEDWLPNKNKVNTGIKGDDELEQTLNSFMDGIDMISSRQNENKNDEVVIDIENEAVNDENKNEEFDITATTGILEQN